MNKIKDKKTDGSGFRRIIQNNLLMLGYSFRAAPFLTLHNLTAHTMNRIIVFVEHTYLLGYIIDAVAQGKPFREVAAFIIGVFVFVISWANIYGSIVGNRVAPVGDQKIRRLILADLYKKAASIDLACYDNPEFYNDYVWAVGDAPNRVAQVVDTCGGILGNLVAVFIGVGYIVTQDLLGLVIVSVSFAGIFTLTKLRQKIVFKQAERVKPLDRKLDYIKRVFYLNDHSKELRLSEITAELFSEFHKASAGITEERNRDRKRLVLIGMLISFVFNDFLVEGAYVLYLMYKTIVLGVLSYGTMVTLYKTCNYIKGSFWGFAYQLPRLQEHSLYIEKTRRFLEYETKVCDPENPVMPDKTGGDLILKGVGFAYDETPVLRNINLTVRQGEKIALVGYNGAGKTTLVKLLMRLYDVTEGEILYGGKNIRKYGLADYRGVYETVFQDYQLFAATVSENITLDTVPLDAERADAALELSGFAAKFETLPGGYGTQITREFDNNGVLLSGGEAQRLVIARALYRDSPIIILDEPSSALDPMAEYNLNKTMMELGRDKTVITISHRLSTTRMADKIYMFEEGEIIESGTHAELMRRAGKYAEMFNLQAEKYRVFE